MHNASVMDSINQFSSIDCVPCEQDSKKQASSHRAKLVHQGVILSDAMTVESLGLSDGDILSLEQVDRVVADGVLSLDLKSFADVLECVRFFSPSMRVIE